MWLSCRATRKGIVLNRSFTRFFTSLSTSALILAAATHRMTSSLSINTIPQSSVSFIGASLAKAIDEQLMKTPGFSIDQLMELAGYSVAWAAHDFCLARKDKTSTSPKVLVVSGPGNNGGDGLVAARHLLHFGYSPHVVYPRPSKSNPNLFRNLIHQCSEAGISVSEALPTQSELDSSNLVIDALFGFSFEGPARSPYTEIIEMMTKTTAPVLAVDIPSGWHVEDGDVYHTGFNPAAVVSLTLPKKCMKAFQGVHYIGGRFVPPKLAVEWNVMMPDYGFGPNQIVRVEPTAPLPAFASMFVTASSMEEAQKIASTLVSERLVACVNILPQVTSVYEWEGKVENGQEVLMMIKTRQALAPAVTQRVKQLHSYQVPESIVVHIDHTGSNPDYLNWVAANTQPKL